MLLFRLCTASVYSIKHMYYAIIRRREFFKMYLKSCFKMTVGFGRCFLAQYNARILNDIFRPFCILRYILRLSSAVEVTLIEMKNWWSHMVVLTILGMHQWKITQLFWRFISSSHNIWTFSQSKIDGVAADKTVSNTSFVPACGGMMSLSCNLEMWALESGSLCPFFHWTPFYLILMPRS